VGHETDFTIADFVADMRAPTPSAAAEIISRDWSEWRQTVADLQARLERTTRHALTGRRRHLAQLASSYALREPRRVVRQWIQRVDDLAENLFAGTQNAIQLRKNSVRLLEARLKVRHPSREIARCRQHLTHLAARLRTLGPQATLDRGYALVLDPAHRPVMQAASSLEGQPVRIVLSKGTLQAVVNEVRPRETLIETLASVTTAAPTPKKPRGRRKTAS
jgi:exodeoxyribonuclease VII large subunit